MQKKYTWKILLLLKNPQFLPNHYETFFNKSIFFHVYFFCITPYIFFLRCTGFCTFSFIINYFYWLTGLTNRTDPDGPGTGDCCRETLVSFLYIFTQPRRKWKNTANFELWHVFYYYFWYVILRHTEIEQRFEQSVV